MNNFTPHFYDHRALSTCDNCGHQEPAEDCGQLSDPQERLCAGDPLPAGDCTECGALSYVATRDHGENAQHWIARVKDSINDYREVQNAYYDGTQADAEAYFRDPDKCLAIARHTQAAADRERYQIIMAANPVVLQDGDL